ncbi:MAG: threonine synthase [Verrucomicrobiota bacterium]|nr:threonine synthase [Verrucomicrobiota bacterium]
MKFTSTRSDVEVDSLYTVLRGLAADGGLYVPARVPRLDASAISSIRDLADAERVALGAMFDDIPADVREAAIANLLAKFPAADPIPLVEADGLHVMELFHGPTGAFKDVALSVLPVLMAEAARKQAGGRKVLILTATSGDTGSAAMAGFADVPGVEIAVFFPNVGTSRVQRLQMTTPAAKNVHGIAIRGNFDDAQAAVKRIFADEKFRAEAESAGTLLSSANSINTGRLVPQIGYYLLAAARLSDKGAFDVVVPSGNFGNILAAYYARMLGAPIRRFVCASNVNDVLARFVATGIYDPGDRFTVTNSPSMDIRRSSNVERLLWLLNDGDSAEVARLMRDFAEKGRYELNDSAKARLMKDFSGGVATPEETEAEMRRMRQACGYVLDPHTAVATAVARRLGLPSDGVPCVVAATATPYKFPETCMRAFGEDVLTAPPPAFAALETAPITQTDVVDVSGIDDSVRALF